MIFMIAIDYISQPIAWIVFLIKVPAICYKFHEAVLKIRICVLRVGEHKHFERYLSLGPISIAYVQAQAPIT